jgi:hypothetical protein
VREALCHWRGLEAFREEDSAFSFGRGSAKDSESPPEPVPLWKVADAQTQTLMVDYYQRLLKGDSARRQSILV